MSVEPLEGWGDRSGPALLGLDDYVPETIFPDDLIILFSPPWNYAFYRKGMNVGIACFTKEESVQNFLRICEGQKFYPDRKTYREVKGLVKGMPVINCLMLMDDISNPVVEPL